MRAKFGDCFRRALPIGAGGATGILIYLMVGGSEKRELMDLPIIWIGLFLTITVLGALALRLKAAMAAKKKGK